MPLSEKDYRWNFIVDSIDFALFSLGMTFGSILTLFPLFAKNLGAGNIEIGLIPAIANLGWGIPAILGAKVSEKASKKLNVVLKFTLGERLPYLFMAFISFFIVPYNPKLALYLSLLMLGIATFSMGFLGPPWMSLIEKVIHPARRGTYFAMGNGLGALMGVGGASLARYFLSNYSFPKNFGYSFLCAGIALLFSFIFLALTREEPDEDKKDDVKFSEYIKGINIVLKDGNFRNYIINRVLGALAGAYTSFIVVFALKKFSIPDKIVADFTGILLVSQGISSFLFGPIGDRWGHKITLIIGRSLSILSLILLLFGNSAFFIYIVFMLIGLIYSSFMVGDLAITLDLAPKNKKELYIGVLNLLIAPFSFLSPLIAGKISDLFGYETLFSISLLVGIFNLFFLIKKIKDPRKENSF
ncbi:MAG: MFS transporter [Dictyoglomus sp.]|nr:MFS transporter [Dictyoglomus sp.]MDW8187907.1 MFS transporter [Dictyoglomus sp.]